MPCIITTRSANQKIARNKQQQKKQKQKFHVETSYLNLKAPSNNVKLQSDKTITTQIYFFPNYKAVGIFP